VAFVIRRTPDIVDRIDGTGGFGGDVIDQLTGENHVTSGFFSRGNAHRSMRHSADSYAKLAADAVFDSGECRNAGAGCSSDDPVVNLM